MNRRQKLALTWGKIHTEKLYPGFERLGSNSLARELDSRPWLCVYVHRADSAVPETDGVFGTVEKQRNAQWQEIFTSADKEVFLRQCDGTIKFVSYARTDDQDRFKEMLPFDRWSYIVFFTGGQPVPPSAKKQVIFDPYSGKGGLIDMANQLYRIVANTSEALIPSRNEVYRKNPDCWWFDQ